MAEVHQFAHGWLDPGLAYVMSFLGCLLGLVISARSRESQGLRRARWLCLAAVAIGGTGVWLMHFMALLGFDVPSSPVRYDVGLTMASLVIGVASVMVGMLAVGLGEPARWKVLVGGAMTGLGLGAMQYTGLAAIRVSGVIVLGPVLVGLSLLTAVVVATVMLWFVVVIRGFSATVGAALIVAFGVGVMHYTGMAAIGVYPTQAALPVDGMSLFVLLPPVSLLACVVMSALAYATVGYSVHQENARQEALLARTRYVYEAAAVGRLNAGSARHR